MSDQPINPLAPTPDAPAKPTRKRAPTTPKRKPKKRGPQHGKRKTEQTPAQPDDRRSDFQRLRDQAMITRLYLKGWQQKAIAVELNLSEATISRDMKAIEAAWEAAKIDDLSKAKRLELQKINQIEAEAWAAWEESKQPYETKITTGQEGKAARAQLKKQSRTGDPRYLLIAMECGKERRKLLGLDAPVKAAFTNPEGDEPAQPFVIMPVHVDYRQAIKPLAPPVSPNEEAMTE